MQDRVLRIIKGNWPSQYTIKDRISLDKPSGEISVNWVSPVAIIIPTYSRCSNIFLNDKRAKLLKNI